AQLVIPLLAGSCTVGPDFERPQPPEVAAYTAGTLPVVTASTSAPGGTAQHVATGRDIPGEWWGLFRSEALNRLIAEALKANPNLAAAEAALRQAHELTLAGKGAFYPVLQAGAAASRNKTAATLSPATASGSLYYSLYSAQLTVSYV